MNAFVALPMGSPVSLQSIFASNPVIRPKLIIDGLGAVVDAPPLALSALSAIPGIAAGTGALPTGLPVPPSLQPWLTAWNRLFNPTFQTALSSRPKKWLAAGTPPAAPAAPPAGPTSTLDGTVAIGLVNVSGPGTAALTPADLVDIGFGLINAINHLTRNAPASAKLVFVVEQQTVTLSVNPATVPAPNGSNSSADIEAREKMWRDPALGAIGQPASFGGITAYRNALLGRTWWGGLHAGKSVVAFITRYNTSISAYAAFGRLVVNLPQTDTFPGRIHIDRVIAHEICHLFDAMDEYAPCNPLATAGPLHVPNGNCILNPLATIGQAPCLMAGTSDDLCTWSRSHLGW